MAQKTIGLIMSSMDSESSIDLYRGIRDTASEYDISTQGFVIFPSSSSSQMYNEGEFFILETIDFSKYDGLIVVFNTISDVTIREKIENSIRESKLPKVTIDCDFEGSYKIENDNYDCVRSLFDLLVDKYHCSKINFISGPADNAESNRRLQAYLDGMKEHGFSSQGRVFTGTFYINDGRPALHYFDHSTKASDYDAIMCGNDMAAISVFNELDSKSSDKVNNVIITGYDSIKEIHSLPIISIKRDNYAIGKKAINLLLDHWMGKNPPPITYFPAKIVEQSSEIDNIRAIKIRKGVSNFVNESSIHDLLRNFVEASNLCNSFKQYLDVLKEYLSMLSPEFFQLVILGEYAEIFEMDDYPIIPMYAANGTRIEMFNALVYENGQFLDITYGAEMMDALGKMQEELKAKNVPDEDIWKIMVQNIPTSQMLNTPLHFLDKKFGFVSFSNSEFPLMTRTYWDWIVILNYTINNICNMMHMKELSMKDHPTELYNRSGLSYYSEKFIAKSAKLGLDLSIIFVDMNGLKFINDNYGHEHGDIAIQTVANVLKAYSPPVSKVFRYGGDEFLILSIGPKEADLKNIIAGIEQQIISSGQEQKLPYEVSASAGYYIRSCDSDENIADCIAKADSVMYTEKEIYKKNHSK